MEEKDASIDDIKRWMEMQQQEELLEEEAEKIRTKLDDMRNKCKHEVIVDLEYFENLGGYNSSRDLVCLFCGRHFEDSRYIESKGCDRTLIDMERYDVFFFSSEERLKIVEEEYTKISKEHPELSRTEIAKLTQKSIDEKYGKYIKQI